MSVPRIGFGLPTFGPDAGPEGVVTVAAAVEEAGFHSVSVTERLLLPTRSDGANGANGAGLPAPHVWEPLEVLTWAAAHTLRVRLLTAVVNAIFQPPIVLARRLATLDRLSRGRLDAGLGQGGGGTPETGFGLAEEFEAAGVPRGRRGAGFVEHIAAMRACWGPDPVEFAGERYRIPASLVGPKPWGERVPVLLGALTRPTVERAARLADGVILVVDDWARAREPIRWYRDAGGTGSVVTPLARDYPGSFIDAALSDLEWAAAEGVDEVHFALGRSGLHPERQADLVLTLAERL
ncbi:LLM class flavin-dependent oxidoreductase [Streptomyces radicis]|uniref:LLM class flavin-dependent oxidoreductase n=1 Tax=Streptomyces radicis TaxID=1750517 RepID=A0A3A9VVF2_9ACTN|nr:LLM class flavin-dependent oxidoreductase [Streptomyces radicis]RKN04888.1 LLM class flavin-dependent oxidoreductase [Streptomyces radicis]RKN25398.1 LLM class flavin-dependent oxidoreductase [Streptomyces radicis]